MAKLKYRHGAPIIFGLNLNGILVTLLGGLVNLMVGVGIYLINTTLKDTRETRDAVISHTQQLKEIKSEQARLRRDYSPVIPKP